MNKNPYYLILSFLLLSCSTIKKENQALTNKGQMPKNIVLMIGDGMGLSQISAGMYKRGGSIKNKTIQGRFLNDDHTATMVPLFAFGPGAEKFIGTCHNHELHYKILEDFQISY